jgi:hypothetical protein
MLNAEKKCRRIKSGKIPFSPEAALWIRQTQIYRLLLQFHDGRIRNRGNLNQTVRWCGIERCKKDCSFWQRLNYVMGKPRSGPVRRVLVEDEQLGTLTEHLTQESVQEAIFNNINRKQFFLAEAALACNRPLRGLFGYNAVTITAQRILEGTYIYPDDFDQATKEI